MVQLNSRELLLCQVDEGLKIRAETPYCEALLDDCRRKVPTRMTLGATIEWVLVCLLGAIAMRDVDSTCEKDARHDSFMIAMGHMSAAAH